MDASRRAVPDFAISMAKAIRNATRGFHFNNDINNIHVHESLSRLFLPATNPDSIFLARFQLIVGPIAEAACSPLCPAEERIDHFVNRLSTAREKPVMSVVEALLATIQQLCPYYPLLTTIQPITVYNQTHNHPLLFHRTKPTEMYFLTTMQQPIRRAMPKGG